MNLFKQIKKMKPNFINSGKKLIASLFIIGILSAPALSNSPFPDVVDDYELPVSFIYEKGIISGYPDGTFRPFQTINRAELLKIIIEARFGDDEIKKALDEYRAKGYSYADYIDVPINEWYTPYVRVGTKHKIVRGYPDGTFRPSQVVNFVEALKITLLAYDWNVSEHPNEWYRNYVEEGSKRHIIPVYIRSFGEPLERGDMTDMITRIIKEKEGTLIDYRKSVRLDTVKMSYECLKNGTCPVQDFGEKNTSGKQTETTPTILVSPQPAISNGNTTNGNLPIQVNAGNLTASQNLSQGYSELFNLRFTNTTQAQQRVTYLRFDFGNQWNIPSGEEIHILDPSGKRVGSLNQNDAQEWIGVPWLSEIIKLSPNETGNVIIAWKNNFFPSSALKQTPLTLTVHQNDGPTSLTAQAQLPRDIVLGFRQGMLESEITEEKRHEKITFAVNKTLADQFPNWKDNAKKFIDEYNKILAVNIKKEFTIGNFIVMDNINDQCDDRTEYYLSNGAFGGLTVFYTFNGSALSCPYFINGDIRKINGQYFGAVFMNIGGDTEKAQPSLDSLPAFVHEAGHAQGLGTPEWYQYFRNREPIEDITEIAPSLGQYIPTFLKGNINEPMIRVNDTPFPYSKFNAWVINHNKDYRWASNIISHIFVSKEVRLKVTDTSGNPVTNADVKIYGMRTNALEELYDDSNRQPLLQNLKTDSGGMAILPLTALERVTRSDDPRMDYTIKAVKVNKDGKSAGAYYSTLDLQYSILMEGKDVYEIRLTLR